MSLRDPGAILVVSCYELGHTPNGAAMPVAFLRRAGFAPAAVDLAAQDLDDDAIDRARVAVISVPMHTALRIGVHVAARIRARNPDCTLCFSGLYAPMNEDYLRASGADWIVGGESEQVLVDFVTAHEEANDSLPHAAVAPMAKLTFPVPARDALPPLRDYARLDTGADEMRIVGYTETTRGCLDTCRHCPVPVVYRGRFFVVDAEVVLRDIEAQVARGAQHITFGDPDFLNGPGHSMAVVRELHRRWPDVSFDITAQVSHLLRDQHRLGELSELGCAFVVTAAESLSDRVLSALRKRHRRSDLERALELCDAANLVVRPTFVPFTPWTTLDDMRELVDFIATHDLIDCVDPIQLSIRLLVPPGSLLLEADELRGAFGELDAEALTHQWVHSDPRVDTLQLALAALCEATATDGTDPRDTFHEARTVIYTACGQRAPVLPVRPRKRVPRITEPWFC